MELNVGWKSTKYVKNLGVYLTKIRHWNWRCYKGLSFEKEIMISSLSLSEVRGGLCNPIYWEDGFCGWPEDREPVWGRTQPSEDPHYFWEQGHYCSQRRCGPGSSRGKRKSNLLSSAQSVVLIYSCYSGVRISTGLGGRSLFCSQVQSDCLEGGVTNASPGHEAKSLKDGIPNFLPSGGRPCKKTTTTNNQFTSFKSLTY